jgi:hypothetical protein
MFKVISECDFIDEFRSYDRYDGFGYKALKALYEYLEEYEEDNERKIELDVVSLCCEYCQYDTAIIAADELLTDFEREEDEENEDFEARCLEELQNNTTVIEYDGGIVVASF